jgi:hypothetical protein
VIKRHDRPAGIPEEDIDPLFEEDAAEDLGAGQDFSQSHASVAVTA